MTIDQYNIHGVYFSPTSTSKQVVQAIIKSLGSPYSEIDITRPENRISSLSFDDNDLLVIGIPVYAGRIPQIIEAYLKKMSGKQTPVILVGVYGNRDYDDMLLELKDLLQEGGFLPISAGAFIGEHSYAVEVANNRPDDQDIAVAKTFASKSRLLLETSDLLAMNLQVKGHQPYKERKERPPLGPIVNEACTMCGICLEACPSGALSMTDQLNVDETLCIQCCSCVKKCPVQAITFTERIPEFRVFLMEKCSLRKEPELFYAIENI